MHDRQTRIAEFRRKLSNGPVFGPFSKCLDPASKEIAGKAGFDLVVIDREHGVHPLDQIYNHLNAAFTGGAFPIVRVSAPNAQEIGAVYDLGAPAIMVPNVSGAGQALEMVRAARYVEDTTRGLCVNVPGADWSATPPSGFFALQETNLLILQVEGKQALAEVEQIARIRGFDVLFLGPTDISKSLGVAGDLMHPTVVDAIQTAIRLAREAGKVVGIYARTIEDAQYWAKLGVQLITYSVDTSLMMRAFQQAIADFHAKG